MDFLSLCPYPLKVENFKALLYITRQEKLNTRLSDIEIAMNVDYRQSICKIYKFSNIVFSSTLSHFSPHIYQQPACRTLTLHYPCILGMTSTS